MTNEDRTLPPALAEVHAEGFFTDHEGHDFEPYDEFMWSVETQEWWRSWTGNPAADVVALRVFGQDSSGGPRRRDGPIGVEERGSDVDRSRTGIEDIGYRAVV